MKFYNTLNRQKEEFKPLEPGKVTLYTCGPTVYDFAHIGNLRAFLFEDILRRHLEFEEMEVLHVMNITDIDDKTIQRVFDINEMTNSSIGLKNMNKLAVPLRSYSVSKYST